MPKPTDITYHSTSRMLDLIFDDGYSCSLSAEYLRVFSPSAEVQGHGPGQGVLQYGKQDVMIKGIEPVGNYALLFRFDDNHETGIFSWEYLYRLGENADTNWEDYLQRLAADGKKRDMNEGSV
ncbi:MAG: DUF971 domain-containing protein [Gammaproteobacteria bacterium]|nr:DUF971 domain-containing protein [Gammaproteobacteria bacterium]